MSVFVRKARTVFLMMLAVLPVFMVRALRPLVVIRFGPLISKRIGHFAGDPEIYLCERDAGMHPRTFDIFYHRKPISNYQIKKMWERIGKLHISPFTNFTHTLDRLNRLLPGGEKHTIVTSSDRDFYGLLARTQAHLSFTPEEEHRGRQALQELGIPNDASFVCFHVRDSAYLDAVLPSYNWRYHDYRDCDIRNYVPAVEELTRQGYFALRMGAIVKEPLNTTSPMIIDYATRYRTDFLDIYLSAKCDFFISESAGISAVPKIFRRPIAYVNFVPLEPDHLFTCAARSLVIPKKFWLRKEGRFLTFREMLDLVMPWSGRGVYEKYTQLGIDIVENTPEEITALVKEMYKRLKGIWKIDEKDEQLQQRFWLLLGPGEQQGKIMVRIGAEFLRQNQEFLA